MPYLSNAVISRQSPFYNFLLCCSESTGDAHKSPRSLQCQIRLGHTHTHTHTDRPITEASHCATRWRGLTSTLRQHMGLPPNSTIRSLSGWLAIHENYVSKYILVHKVHTTNRHICMQPHTSIGTLTHMHTVHKHCEQRKQTESIYITCACEHITCTVSHTRETHSSQRHTYTCAVPCSGAGKR